MNNNSKEKNSTWTNRDWFWLFGILIGIIILLIATIFAKSAKIETNFSIISSAVSIALALVAIFYALKQDSDNRRVNDNVSGILHNLSTEMGLVKNSVEKITDKDIDTIAQSTLNEINKVDKQTSYSAEEVKKIVEDAVNNFSKNVKTKVEKNNFSLREENFDYNSLLNLIKEILDEDTEEIKSLNYIQEEFQLRYGIVISKNLIKKVMRDINYYNTY